MKSESTIMDARGLTAALRRHAITSPALWLSLAGVVMLGACAAPPPLPDTPPLAANLNLLNQPAQVQSLPDLPPHALNLDDGLDETEAAMLAVANNPDLQALRAAAGVADATLFAAGLLPDPQISATIDRPDEKLVRPGDGVDLVNGFNYAFGYDLSSLITVGARRSGARATHAQARMDLVWAEWQVAQQARILHRKLVGLARRTRLLADYRAAFADRYARSERALAAGDITLEQTSGDLVGVLDAEARSRDQALLLIDTEQAFRALLGLSPSAPLPILAVLLPQAPPDATTVADILASLGERRPDLRALAAGYQAQDAKLRAALLNRLPNITLSLSRTRDTSGIFTAGLGLSLSLPFLDGNRGAIRIERATATQLRAEYGARLAQTYADVARLIGTRDALAAQLVELQARLPALQALAAKAEAGVDHHDLDPLIYLTLRSSLLSAQLDIEDRTQAMTEDEAALSTLLGLPPERWTRNDGQGQAQ